jgi:hypothetical protein
MGGRACSYLRRNSVPPSGGPPPWPLLRSRSQRTSYVVGCAGTLEPTHHPRLSCGSRPKDASGVPLSRPERAIRMCCVARRTERRQHDSDQSCPRPWDAGSKRPSGHRSWHEPCASRADVVQTTSAYGACVSYDTYAPNGPSALEKLRAERWHTDRMCHMTHTIRSLMLFAQHQQGLP